MSDATADPNYQKALAKINRARDRNLTILDLGCNRLTTLPVEICRLTNLTTLGLVNNRLTTLPVEISQLTNLTGLYLSSNQLTTLPIGICQLTRLIELYLGGNPIHDTLKQQGVNPENTQQVLSHYRRIANHHNFLIVYSALALGCPYPVANALAIHWPTI